MPTLFEPSVKPVSTYDLSYIREAIKEAIDKYANLGLQSKVSDPFLMFEDIKTGSNIQRWPWYNNRIPGFKGKYSRGPGQIHIMLPHDRENVYHYIEKTLKPKYVDIAKFLEQVWLHEARHAKDHSKGKLMHNPYDNMMEYDQYVKEPNEVRANTQQLSQLIRDNNLNVPKSYLELDDLIDEFYQPNSSQSISLTQYDPKLYPYSYNFDNIKRYLEEFMDEGDITDVPSDIQIKSLQRPSSLINTLKDLR